MTFKLIQPPIKVSFDGDRGINLPWVQWTKQMYEITNTTVQSGTTANRPIKLFVGQMYFDISLGANGKPIWVRKDGLGWVDATGANA